MSTREDVAEEARRILHAEIRRLRSLSHAELVRYLEPDAFEVTAPSGRTFQVEILAVWDDRKRRHLRVLMHMDDGTGMRAKPFISEDFIVAPDGSFIGEP